MKRLTLLILLIISASHAIGQVTDEDMEVEKAPAGIQLRLPTRVGNYMVGSNFLFTNATFQEGVETNYNLGLSPKVGYFILPNIALGLSGNLIISGNKSYYSVNYGVSPFARLYFAHNNENKPARPLQFFVEGGVGYGGTNTRYEGGSGATDVSTNGLRLYLLPGVDYFVNDHVAAELGLEYLFISGDPDAHIAALNIGFQIFLGR